MPLVAVNVNPTYGEFTVPIGSSASLTVGAGGLCMTIVNLLVVCADEFESVAVNETGYVPGVLGLPQMMLCTVNPNG